MKKVFIPKGAIVQHDSLYTDRLIVKGTLLVKGKTVAEEIIGNGVIEAQEISCGDIRAGSVTAGFIFSRRIAVNKLFVHGECWASECIAVSDFAGVHYVSTGKLTVSLSDIHAVDADEIITLSQKRRGLLGLLWASWWRSFFVSLLYGGEYADKDNGEPQKERNMFTGGSVDSTSHETPDNGKTNAAA